MPLDPGRRHEVMRALAAVPGLLDELDTTLSRGDAVGAPRVTGAAGGGGRRPALPFRKGASDAHAELARTLRYYAVRVAILARRPAPRAPGEQSVFLCRQLPRIPDDAPVLAGIHPALPDAVAAARAAIDRPADRLCIGLCDCGSRLYGVEEQTVVRCPGCDREYAVAERRGSLLAQARDMVGTATELARILPWFSGKPVTANAIRQWAARGKLTGYTVAGETVYRIGDVLRVHEHGRG
ncbi:hypothetical protein ACFVUS_32380 [Nocardia sp. NPDC058058]|uniref:hypothetical protein n=1 Tax=Nocardia sp. NPDC058058 TaxID=3346317 RepID=UPI0036DBF101